MSRRDEIIEAAIRLAETGEPRRTTLSVRAVAKEAGIGASTLRHYFPTQADLYIEVARRSMQMNISDFRIEDASIPPRERLYEVLSQFLTTHEHRDAQLELWLAMHFNALGPNPREGSQALLDYAHEITYDCLHRWLGVLADEGHLDPAEVGRAATILFTAIDGMGLHSIISPDRMTVDEMHANIKWLIDRLLA